VGKKYLEKVKLVDRSKLYTLEEAVKLVKQTNPASFDETVDLAIKLGVDLKKSESVRGTVNLPAGTGKKVKVAVIAKGEKLKEAEGAGADHFGAEDIIEKINSGWLDFDVLLATPDMMGPLSKLGKILGPKGLMPNPKSGTVTFDIGKTVKDFKTGKAEFRMDKGGVVHLPLGKVSFEEGKLAENFWTAVEAILKAKPSSAKGGFLRSLTLSSTMGPGIRLDPQKVSLEVEKRRI